MHTLDDFILFDKDLSQINRTEESYLKKRAQVDQNKKKVSPKKRGRKKNPGKLITSPSHNILNLEELYVLHVRFLRQNILFYMQAEEMMNLI